jgi:hypothetical protein
MIGVICVAVISVGVVGLFRDPGPDEYHDPMNAPIRTPSPRGSTVWTE